MIKDIQPIKRSTVSPIQGMRTIIDERKWPSGREELSTSWIITVGVDSIAPTDKCMFQHIIIQWILKLFPLKTANKRKLVKKNLHVSDQLRTLWPI